MLTTFKIHRHVPFSTEKLPDPDGGNTTYATCICGAMKMLGGWRWYSRARIRAEHAQ